LDSVKCSSTFHFDALRLRFLVWRHTTDRVGGKHESLCVDSISRARRHKLIPLPSCLRTEGFRAPSRSRGIYTSRVYPSHRGAETSCVKRLFGLSSGRNFDCRDVDIACVIYASKIIRNETMLMTEYRTSACVLAKRCRHFRCDCLMPAQTGTRPRSPQVHDPGQLLSNPSTHSNCTAITVDLRQLLVSLVYDEVQSGLLFTVQSGLATLVSRAFSNFNLSFAHVLQGPAPGVVCENTLLVHIGEIGNSTDSFSRETSKNFWEHILHFFIRQ
jgi:hypothetical protein